MLKSNENVDDRSRNGSNAENFPKRENVSFIKMVEKTLGRRNLISNYSMWQITKFFRIHEFADFVVCNNEEERQQSNEFFRRVAYYLIFNRHLRTKVRELYYFKFTSNQLACINHVYKGIYVPVGEYDELYPKWLLFDYIDNEGENTFDLGDTETFKARIYTIHQIEFEVFVNLIIEIWEADKDKVALECEYLAKDWRDIQEIRERKQEDFKKKHINELMEICEANKNKSGYIKVNVKPDYTPDEDGFKFVEVNTEDLSIDQIGLYKNNSFVIVELFWEATYIEESWKIFYDESYPVLEN